MSSHKERFLQELRTFSDREKAHSSKLYHKSNREHWGVTAPRYNELVKSFSKQLSEEEILSLASSLWQTNIFDPMICAAKLLELKKVKPSLQLWNMIKEFLKSIDGWALEDTLAHAAWKCILSNNSLLNELEAWTYHTNFWMRRAALIYTLPFAKKGKDAEQMLRWAALYATDSEWFIQKAIGWWLRVLGEHNPERVVLFLKDHSHKLKSVAKKEATRKLPHEFNIFAN